MEEGRRAKESQMSGSFYLFLVVFIFDFLYALYVRLQISKDSLKRLGQFKQTAVH